MPGAASESVVHEVVSSNASSNASASGVFSVPTPCTFSAPPLTIGPLGE